MKGRFSGATISTTSPTFVATAGQAAAIASTNEIGNCSLSEDKANISKRPIKFHGSFMKPGKQRRSEEHTSELQSLMRISYAVFCLKKKIKLTKYNKHVTSYITRT